MKGAGLRIRGFSRQLSVAELPLWTFAAWCLALIVRSHLPFLAKPSEASIDEGYVVAIGQLLLHGRMLPFVDAVAHTGPMFMFSGALLALIDPFSWLPIRVLAVLCFALCSVLAFACARRAGRLVGAAVAAAGVPFYVTLRMDPSDSIAFNAELPAAVFTLASMYAALRALAREDAPISARWLCASGLLTSCAALSKQVAALLIPPVAAYVAINVLLRDDLTRKRRVQLLALYCGSALAPALLLFIRLAAAGALAEAYYYLVTYNSGPYMFPYREVSARAEYVKWITARPVELAACAIAVAWGLAQPLAARTGESSWPTAIRRGSFDFTVAAMALGGVIAARASLRGFEHYFVLVVPGFSLLVASIFDRAVAARASPASPRVSTGYRALLLAPLVLLGEVAWKDNPGTSRAWSTQHLSVVSVDMAHEEPPVCAFVREHSEPGDRLFVWGFRAQLNVSCGRLPATRFVYSTFLSGYVPGANLPSEVEESLVRPGLREQLLADLEQTKPPIIVDAARTMGMRQFQRIPVLKQYIEQNYYMASVVGGDQVWLRRDRPTRAAR